MEETFNAKAIILRRLPFREADSRITVYTRDQGKLELVARGTRKQKSKLAGHIEPLNLVNLMVVRGRQFDYAGSVFTENAFLEIKKDLAKVQIAGEAIGIFNKLIKVEAADEGLFFLLHDFLIILDSGLILEEGLELFQYFFIFKLLNQLGYGPELYECLVCKDNLKSRKFSFNISQGGLICDNCKSEEKNLTVSVNCAKLLRLSQDNSFVYLAKIKVNLNTNKEAINLIRSFYNYIIA